MIIQDTSTPSLATAAQATGPNPAADIELPQTTTVEEQPKGLSADEASTFGWEEPAQVDALEQKLIDPANAETFSDPQTSETEEVTDASPGSGQDTSGNAPAPQIDPNQQMMLMMYQQMQANQQVQMDFQRQLVESIRPPKPAEPEVDPMADLPEKFRNIEGLSDALKYVYQKNKSDVSAFEQKLEARIQAATQQREADRYTHEAVGIGSKILQKGFVFDKPNESAVVTDAIRDMSLSLANVRGESPAAYEQAMNRIIDTAVRGRINYLNQQAKQKVVQRGQTPSRPQLVSTNAIPQSAQSQEPSLAEVRGAGYRNMEDAQWDDFSKVFAKRARARG